MHISFAPFFAIRAVERGILNMPGGKKKVKHAVALPASSKQTTNRLSRKTLPALAGARHTKKIDHRKAAYRLMHTKEWHEPPPAHLVGKLAVPKITSKHATYFEIADNDGKKKKLETHVSIIHMVITVY